METRRKKAGAAAQKAPAVSATGRDCATPHLTAFPSDSQTGPGTVTEVCVKSGRKRKRFFILFPIIKNLAGRAWAIAT